jgi:hypothetical protein
MLTDFSDDFKAVIRDSIYYYQLTELFPKSDEPSVHHQISETFKIK